MRTRWGRGLDVEHPLPEHPRPQLERDRWVSLNGVWECSFSPTGAPARVWQPIVVPFSPESELSGVRRQLLPDETLHYRRDVDLPDDFPPGHRVLLHLGAVDQRCRVRVNGTDVGGGECGYLPITCDVTDVARRTGNTLEVQVTDPSDTGQGMRGKQRLERGGIWYTATSGIWQSVWLESVPPAYVVRLELTPWQRDGSWGLTVLLEPGGTASTDDPARVRLGLPGGGTDEHEVPLGRPAEVVVTAARPWTPDDPHLYAVEVTLGEGADADTVTSYAALRTTSVGPDADRTPRLLLNREPVFHAGVLDQGYWPDGLLTAPSDAAVVADLEAVRRLGFTVVRKHVKVEPLRWYHHCDRLGLLVWQDLPNGGAPYVGRVINGMSSVPERPRRLHGRADAAGRAGFERDAAALVRHLRGVPSIVLWTVFNEGWGQFDTLRVGTAVERLDPSRPVVHASGWHDRGGGQVTTRHEYLRPWRLPSRTDDRRVLALGEYGGVALPVPGHTWGERPWGYRDAESPEDLTAHVVRLHDACLAPTVAGGLSAAVWTQLTDVEDEHNGLLTWDREVIKPDAAAVRASLDRLRATVTDRGTGAESP